MTVPQSIITFHSTHHALAAERVLTSVAIPFKLIPPPRIFSSDCGIAVCIKSDQQRSTLTLLKENNIPVEAVHEWKVDPSDLP